MNKSVILEYKSNNCIMDYKNIDDMMRNIDNEYNQIDQLTFIFTANMLDYQSLHIHKTLMNYTKNNNNLLILNLETENLNYFTKIYKNINGNCNNNICRNNHYHNESCPLIFRKVLSNNLYRLISPWVFDNDNYVKNNYPTGSNPILLYSNIDNITNTDIFKIGEMNTGVIMYSTKISNIFIDIALNVITNWIHNKAKCMRKIGFYY
jgi:hypothetical protein